MPEKPRADKGLKCPLYKQDMSKVCHTCAWYTQIRGQDPQTAKEVDHWGCAVGFLPMIGIEGAMQSRQTGAAVESLRNETVKRQDLILESSLPVNGMRRLEN